MIESSPARLAAKYDRNQRKYGGTEVCRECGNEFTWERTGPGGIPRICSDECRTRRANAYSTRYRERVPPLEDGDPRHGTLSGYVTHSCDCAKCREFWRVYRGGKPATQATEQGG
jgi:hypothetical protein